MTTIKEPPATKLSLAEILAVFIGGTDSLRFTAYDGSSAGVETRHWGWIS